MILDPEHVTALVEKWTGRLGIGPEWSIGVKIVTDKAEAAEEDQDHFAYSQTKAAYFVADITFHAWLFDDKDEAFLDLVACHEVLHVALNKIETLVENALGEDNENFAEILTENTVETLSRALVRLQNAH